MALTTHVSAPQGSAPASPVSWILFVATFVVFLIVAVAAQLLALKWRAWFPGAEGGSSLIGSVKTAVYTVMSHVI